MYEFFLKEPFIKKKNFRLKLNVGLITGTENSFNTFFYTTN